MATNKIIYGIDLGTTNSAIARFENGTSVIKKSGLGSDTTPSCVSVSPKGKISVGQKALAQLGKDYQLSSIKEGYQVNSFVEFKRVMGTDEKIHCSNLNKDFTPEELSAEVLKELRKYVLDDDVKTAVITVPAMFDNNQKDATKRAAKLAGFDHFELIQEPVAASVSYGLGSKMKNAYWLVFDFGGGTFDVALMKIEDGIMKAVDTAGNNKLGGKDIDNAIVDKLFIPYFRKNYVMDDILATKEEHFKNMWKPKAEEAKIQLSFNQSVDIQTDLGDSFGQDDEGTDFEIDITFTQDIFEPIAAPIYQKAIDITKKLLEKNNLTGNQLGALILVGGPTHSPIVRKMLKEQITQNVDTSIDPMTCVACGAALYASTLEVPEEIVDKNRDRSKVQLDVTIKSTSVEDIEFASVKLLPEKCDNYKGADVMVEFVRNDGVFQTGKVKIDAIGDVIDLVLLKDCTNIFVIHCFDNMGNMLECEPTTISIIQGIDGIGDAVMPMFLGIGIANEKGDEVFAKIDGLEKSHILPADGVIHSLHTPKEIRTGIEADEIRITLYQADDYNENMKAIYCNRQYDVTFTGDDIPNLLPANSEVNIRLHADKSGTIDKFIVNIPYLDLDVDLTDRITLSTKKAVSLSFIRNEIKQTRKKANEIHNQELLAMISEIEQNFNNAPEDRDSKDNALALLKEASKKVDVEYSLGEWDRLEQKLRGMFDELEQDNKKYGNPQTTQIVEQLRGEVDKVICTKNIKVGEDLYDQMWSFDYRIAEVDFYIVWIAGWHRDFDQKSWSNRERARSLINQGLTIINDTPTAERLKSIAFEIRNLLPDGEKPTNILGK